MTMDYSGAQDDWNTTQIYAHAMDQAFNNTFGKSLVDAAFRGDWQRNTKGRAPYLDSWTLPETGITFFASPNLTHCCVEISGSGCERLIEMELLNDVLRFVQDRVTRIDIATDIDTDVRPCDFVRELTHKRMRASGMQRSSTGETEYVGSQKSERYARVYRYNPPHPRSHLLRIEHVFRKEYAKRVAQACIEADTTSVANAAGIAFGWGHAIWQPKVAVHLDISVHTGSKSDNNTVYWLVNSCAPAFKKLVEKGVLPDPVSFLTQYFLEGE